MSRHRLSLRRKKAKEMANMDDEIECGQTPLFLKFNDDFNYQDSQTSNEETIKRKAIGTVKELLQKKLKIMTLRDVMEISGAKNRTAGFLKVNVDFHPIFGSDEAEQFFKPKIEKLKVETTAYVTERINSFCNEFVQIVNIEVNNVVEKASEDIGSATTEATAARKNLYDEAQEQINEAAEKRKAFVESYRSKDFIKRAEGENERPKRRRDNDTTEKRQSKHRK